MTEDSSDVEWLRALAWEEDARPYDNAAEAAAKVAKIRAIADSLEAKDDEIERSRGELAEKDKVSNARMELLDQRVAQLATANDQLARWRGIAAKLEKELSETRAERDAAVALVAKLEAVVRDGIEHVESDAGAWGGWLVRAQMALRAIKKQGS